MRASAKVRNVLIGLVSAAALTTGVLAVTAASASAATTAPASASAPASQSALAGPWYGCYGYGCIGKSAQVQGCSKDATTVFAASAYDAVYRTRVTLRLRYSSGCQSMWATVTDTNNPDRATFWIYDRGTHALEVATTQRSIFTRQWQETLMVGVAATKAQACIEVHTGHGTSTPFCTPFFGH
jgi:hypothetical protein